MNNLKNAFLKLIKKVAPSDWYATEYWENESYCRDELEKAIYTFDIDANHFEIINGLYAKDVPSVRKFLKATLKATEKKYNPYKVRIYFLSDYPLITAARGASYLGTLSVLNKIKNLISSGVVVAIAFEPNAEDAYHAKDKLAYESGSAKYLSIPKTKASLLSLLKENNNLLQIDKDAYITVYYVAEKYLDPKYNQPEYAEYKRRILQDLGGCYFLSYLRGTPAKVNQRKIGNFYTFTINDLPVLGSSSHFVNKWAGISYEDAIEASPNSEIRNMITQYVEYMSTTSK